MSSKTATVDFLVQRIVTNADLAAYQGDPKAQEEIKSDARKLAKLAFVEGDAFDPEILAPVCPRDGS